MVIVKVQLKGVCGCQRCKAKERAFFFRMEGSLTHNLANCGILAAANIYEVEKRLSTSEAAGEVFHQGRRSDKSSLRTAIGKTFEVGINADDDPNVSWAFDDINGGPLCDGVVECLCCTLAALLAIAKRKVVEDHAISIDKD